MNEPSPRRSLHFTAARSVAVVEEEVAAPSAGQLLVRTVVSAISAGTEMLVYRDEVPRAMALDASIPGLTEHSSFPLKYGYSAVGRIVDVGAGVSRDWLGTLVFSLHPHESHFLASEHELEPVPEGVPAELAAMFPNVETAVTLVMDGRPMVGECVAVLGQGVVGLMTTALLARFPLARLVKWRALKVFWCLYPLLVVFVIVVTANHFIADAVLGAAAAGIGALAARAMARARPHVWCFEPAQAQVQPAQAGP